jgi:serine protease Do
MKRLKSWLAPLALVTVGAAGAIGATHIDVSWNSAAAAAPPAPVASEPTLPPPSPAQIADARQVGRTFAQVASQISPSVVRISVTKPVEGIGGFGLGPGDPFGGSPFERFFEQRRGGGGRQRELPKQQGTGSGVVIDGGGYILTNNHVVDDASDVRVTFHDGTTVSGKVIGSDPATDLAVVKVSGVAVKPAELGDSNRVAVGDWVIAVGNPFGLDHTVTVGVLSAKNRSGLMGGQNYQDFLQTDASINPGNSGGPLVALDGKVIGINTMIAGIGTGIGFAVPTSMAEPIARQLIATGKVRRSYLGIQMQPLDDQTQKALGQGAPAKGTLVRQVEAGSPAAKSGLQPGDVIVGIGSDPVEDGRDVQRHVFDKPVGTAIPLRVWRDGKQITIEARTGERPAADAADEPIVAEGRGGQARGKVGVQLQTMTPELARELELAAGTRGAVVLGVAPGSPAAEAGLERGDAIVSVDRKPVQSAKDAAAALGAEREGGHLVRVQRAAGARFVVIGGAQE